MSDFVSRIRMTSASLAGAHPQDILRWVANLGLRIIMIGIMLGVTRLLSAEPFRVKPSDPLAYLAVAVALTRIACLAGDIPAGRATKVDPMVVLRYE